MTLDFYLPEYLDLPTYEGPEGVTVFGTDEYTGGRRMCIAGSVYRTTTTLTEISWWSSSPIRGIGKQPEALS